MKKKSILATVLKLGGFILPGNFLKTFVYLNFVHKPRKLFRMALHSFYRIDHVYEVIAEFKNSYRGNFTILEFGTAQGNAFTKMLYATRYLGMDHRIVVHGFDSFEGMPKASADGDQDLIANDSWIEGQFNSDFDELDAYCRSNYTNYRLHRGFFEDSITDDFLDALNETPPILIWIDCDFYSSTKAVFERLIPHIPTGCVVYFDEYEFNFGSRFTGEARAVHEINSGKFGSGIELVKDDQLSLDSNRVYRFINANRDKGFERITALNWVERKKPRSNDSPLPG